MFASFNTAILFCYLQGRGTFSSLLPCTLSCACATVTATVIIIIIIGLLLCIAKSVKVSLLCLHNSESITYDRNSSTHSSICKKGSRIMSCELELMVGINWNCFVFACKFRFLQLLLCARTIFISTSSI